MSIRILPSLLTVGNLAFGMMSIFFVLWENYPLAGVMIIVSMILDVLDGKIARKLDVSSSFGKELDSLADVVSFGVAPAVLVYDQVLAVYDVLGMAVVIWFAVAGALRLARFNIQTTVGYYQGVPITAAGSLIALINIRPDFIPSLALLILTAVLGCLMVSKIRVPKL